MCRPFQAQRSPKLPHNAWGNNSLLPKKTFAQTGFYIWLESFSEALPWLLEPFPALKKLSFLLHLTKVRQKWRVFKLAAPEYFNGPYSWQEYSNAHYRTNRVYWNFSFVQLLLSQLWTPKLHVFGNVNTFTAQPIFKFRRRFVRTLQIRVDTILTEPFNLTQHFTVGKLKYFAYWHGTDIETTQAEQ